MPCIIHTLFFASCGHETSTIDHEWSWEPTSERCPVAAPRAEGFLPRVLTLIVPPRCIATHPNYTYIERECPLCQVGNPPSNVSAVVLLQRREFYRRVWNEQEDLRIRRREDTVLGELCHESDCAQWTERINFARASGNRTQHEEVLVLAEAEARRIPARRETLRRARLAANEARARRRRLVNALLAAGGPIADAIVHRHLERWQSIHEAVRSAEQARGIPLRDQRLMYYPIRHQSDDPFLEQSELEDGEECPICHENEEYDMDEDVRRLPCRHKFHLTCIVAWLDTGFSRCPYCRQPYKLVRPPAFARAGGSEETPAV